MVVKLTEFISNKDMDRFYLIVSQLMCNPDHHHKK